MQHLETDSTDTAPHRARRHNPRASWVRFGAGCLVVCALIPDVATAGRLEQVCGDAPVTTLDSQVLRQIDVDLGIRAKLTTGTSVEGEGAATLTSGSRKVATTVDLLGVDATARDVAQYRLCTWMLNGLITRDFFSEQVRWLNGMSLPHASGARAQELRVAGGTAAPEAGGHDAVSDPRAAGAPHSSAPTVASLYSLTPRDLLGRWSVESSLRTGSCKPDPKVDTDFYLWDVVPGADGTVSVTVSGTTAYPVLSGAFNDINLTLGGVVDGGKYEPGHLVGALLADVGYTQLYAFSRSDFRLTATSSTRLIGERIVSVLPSGASPAGPKIAFLMPCALVYDVTATKQ